ncbi:MAG: VOC family protein [Actinomycetota bacterium]|nr:VOC family protein [Actinomycetota bacterium]
MGFHHVALATNDPAATQRFYTEVMGFELVKVVTGPTPGGGGWSRHFFFETGASGDAGMIAFWEIHDDKIGEGFRTDLSRSLGLPVWVNHLAWDAPTLEDPALHRERWREHGITVAQVDHGFCTSIYATDPNGIMVEFCCTTRAFTAEEKAEAERLLADPAPPLEAEPSVRIYEPVDAGALA